MGENKAVPRKTASYGEVVRFRVTAEEKGGARRRQRARRIAGIRGHPPSFARRNGAVSAGCRRRSTGDRKASGAVAQDRRQSQSGRSRHECRPRRLRTSSRQKPRGASRNDAADEQAACGHGAASPGTTEPGSMSGYFTELALSIDAMLGDNAPAVEAGITDDLSEAEEIRRRAYAATVAAWGSPAAELGTDNAPATRSAGRAAGMGKGSAKVSSTQRPAVAAQAKTAAPSGREIRCHRNFDAKRACSAAHGGGSSCRPEGLGNHHRRSTAVYRAK